MFRVAPVAAISIAVASAIGLAACQASPTATPPGAVLWTARYNGPGNRADQAMASAISPNGATLFATGTSTGASRRRDYATIAYRAGSGRKLWVSRYGGPGFLGATPYAIAVSPSGRTVFIAGIAPAPAASGRGDRVLDYVTVAYSARTGARLWVSGYYGPPAATGSVRTTALAVSPDGRTVYIDGATDRGFATVAYNAATGAQLWSATLAPRNYQSFYASSAAAVSPDGRTVLIAVIARSGPRYPAPAVSVLAYSAATGKALWQRSAGTAPGLPGRATLAITPGGRTIVVAATTQASRKPGQYLTIGYNAATGDRRWARTYGGSRQSDFAAALGLSPSGRTVYVTGLRRSLPRGPAEFATVAYDTATGAPVWARTYRTVPAALQADMAIRRSGRVLVAGSLGYFHLVTLSYSPAGRRIWARRFGRQNSVSIVSSVIVSPVSGDVYVTGSSDGEASRSENYVTVAYRG